MSLAELLKAVEWFDGEVDVVRAELCGGRDMSLLHLPPAKAQRLAAWLAHPTAARKAAYEAVKADAFHPIAMALHRLANPEKYVRAPRRQAPAAKSQVRTFDAIAAFLADEDETP